MKSLVVSASPLFVSLSLLIGSAGCGGDSGGGFDGKNSPYGPRTPTTKTASTLKFSLGGIISSPDIAQTTTVIGQKTIGGKSYDRLATLNVADPTQGGEYWIKENPDSNTVDFAGVDLHSTLAAVLVPPGSVVLDTPVTLKLDVPLGQVQPLTASGTYTPAGASTGTPVQVTGQYTLVGKDEVVQTDMGPVAGCSHYSGKASSTSAAVPAVLRGLTVNAELWYHPSFGVVAFTAPDLGLASKMKDTNDCGARDSSGFKTIRKVGIVGGTQGQFELSAYGCAGDFDADKNTHAKMLLEMRYLDETKAKSATQPTASQRFETIFGYFPSTLVQSPGSLLHPEENGKGYVYWIAYVDQAAKNQSTNGISYGIKVTTASADLVRVSARIHYKTYP